MQTTYTGRTIPTTTLTGRTKPGDFVFYTLDSCPDTWYTATYTWDTSGVGIPITTYTGRPLI